MRLQNHDIEMENELRGGLCKRVKKSEHANVTLRLVEPLIIDRMAGFFRFKTGFQHHQVPGRCAIQY